MPRAMKYDQLRTMSDDDLIALYDATTTNVVVGLGFIREELWRRDMDRAQQKANDAAVTTKRLTWIILVLTLANVAVVAVQALAT